MPGILKEDPEALFVAGSLARYQDAADPWKLLVVWKIDEVPWIIGISWDLLVVFHGDFMEDWGIGWVKKRAKGWSTASPYVDHRSSGSGNFLCLTVQKKRTTRWDVNHPQWEKNKQRERGYIGNGMTNRCVCVPSEQMQNFCVDSVLHFSIFIFQFAGGMAAVS